MVVLDEGDEESVQYLPATIVKAIKESKEAGVTHLMHFDDGDFEKATQPPMLLCLFWPGPNLA